MTIEKFKLYISGIVERAKRDGRKFVLPYESSAVNHETTDCISLCSSPVYVNGSPIFDDGLLSTEEKDTQEKVLAWITLKCVAQKSVNKRWSSYGLKHILENDTGIYLTNNQFKNAMLISGHYPEDASKLNWYFRISESALRRKE